MHTRHACALTLCLRDTQIRVPVPVPGTTMNHDAAKHHSKHIGYDTVSFLMDLSAHPQVGLCLAVDCIGVSVVWNAVLA